MDDLAVEETRDSFACCDSGLVEAPIAPRIVPTSQAIQRLTTHAGDRHTLAMRCPPHGGLVWTIYEGIRAGGLFDAVALGSGQVQEILVHASRNKGDGHRLDAWVITMTAIYSAVGIRNAALNDRIRQAFMRSVATLRRL